jgi:hypothetical protein
LSLEELDIPVSCGASPVGAARQEDEGEIARVARRMEELAGSFMMTRANVLDVGRVKGDIRRLAGLGMIKLCRRDDEEFWAKSGSSL